MSRNGEGRWALRRAHAKVVIKVRAFACQMIIRAIPSSDMSWCEDYIDPFPRECEHGVPDGINCDECADEAMEDDQED